MEAKQITSIAARCKGCGIIFDLAYDLEAEPVQMERGFSQVLRKLGKKADMCWECRHLN